MSLTAQDLDRFARSPGWRATRLEVFDSAAGKVIVKGQRAPHQDLRARQLRHGADGRGVRADPTAPAGGGPR